MFARILFSTFSFGKNYTTDSYVLLHIEDIIDNMQVGFIESLIFISYIYFTSNLIYFKFNLNLVFKNEPFDLVITNYAAYPFQFDMCA